METTMSDNKLANTGKASATIESGKKASGKIIDLPITEKIIESAEEFKAGTIKTYDTSIRVSKENPLTSLAIATCVKTFV